MQYIFISTNNLKVFDKTVCYIQSFMDYLLLKSNPKELQILFIKPDVTVDSVFLCINSSVKGNTDIQE